MKYSRTFIKILIGAFIVFGLFSAWYTQKYSMGIAPSYSVNTPESSQSLLIVTQASEFKDKVVGRVVDHYSSRDMFIRVNDVTYLPSIDFDEWSAVVIIHTWEIGRPPEPVRDLVEDNDDLSGIIFFATSGSGDEYIRGVDGITGASKLTTVSTKSSDLIKRINKKLSP